MNKRYRLVVFDWEGTLSDTLGQVLNCVATEAQRLNFGALNEDLARQCVELGLVKAVKKLFPHLSLQQHQQLLDAIQQSLMSRHGEVYLIPGAKDLVQRLHYNGVHLAIASNKGAQSLQRALHSTGLDEFFKVYRCAGQVPPKPCSQMLEEILFQFDVPIEEAIMVGDTITDIETAKNIGMDAIGVNFYHQSSETLLSAGALEVFDDYQSLAHYLNLSIEGDICL